MSITCFSQECVFHNRIDSQVTQGCILSTPVILHKGTCRYYKTNVQGALQNELLADRQDLGDGNYLKWVKDKERAEHRDCKEAGRAQG